MTLSAPQERHEDHERRPVTRELPTGAAVEAIRPLLTRLLGHDPAVTIELWDGSAFGSSEGVGRLRIRSADALRRLVWAPGELGLARAHIAGDLDVDGDVIAVVAALRDATKNDLGIGILPATLRAARRLGALGRPLPPPSEEARVRGRRHSRRRDEQAVRHHYDVGNDFYELVLGPTMTYSCAYYGHANATLEDAQTAKHDLICRKLGLPDHPRARLLDVGCGWGSMAIHAATHYGAAVVGITISPEQARRAQERVRDASVDHLVEIRLQDYRDLHDEPFDAISSIGMFEHVGKRQMSDYFRTLRSHLHPEGRLLNHAISSTNGSRLAGRSFTGRYVFPDGELLDVGEVVLAMEAAGLEVRDVEGLREHYARTLRAWVGNLEESWDRAVELVGEPRARVWRLYMAASAVGFDDGGVALHQVLGVVPSPSGATGMPRTRDAWSVARATLPA
ncbi:MAG: class I SAM-dependent methyltransferase [Microthrixaceae bacterium]